MSYKLSFSEEFVERFEKLPKKLKSRIYKKIKILKQVPRKGKPLKASLKGLWSLRVGKYRVIYKIFRKKKTILLVTVGHRKKVYRMKILKMRKFKKG